MNPIQILTRLNVQQATHRLSEDKVKQCVDPKLKEYPAKGVAKVCPQQSLLYCSSLNLSLSRMFSDPVKMCCAVAAGCSGGSVRAVRGRVQTEHEHCG